MSRHGKLKYGVIQIPSVCDVCDRSRRKGNHEKCSKIRQARHGHLERAQ